MDTEWMKDIVSACSCSWRIDQSAVRMGYGRERVEELTS